ncbi:MAG: glucose-6-phosphate isomerase [Hyphomonadaceae bacterium]|nr:glucose-6-phosphate isomerase [Hyphomonadaceae bacterium]
MTDLEHDLRTRACNARDRSIEQLYADTGRLDDLTMQVGGLVFDFTKQQVDRAELDLLAGWAAARDVTGWRARLFGGEPVNSTEGRAVLHPALRDPSRSWAALGEDVSADTARSQAAATAFANAVRDGTYCAGDGRPFKSIVHLGIGGSDLGPRLVHEALAPLGGGALDLRFAANIEPHELNAALHGLDPRETLVVCVSKTFTTIETLTNLAAVRAWMSGAVADDGPHLVAVSAAPDTAVIMGFDRARVFDFRDWVGGRYSLWSAVSLSVEIALGPDIMADLRAGAAVMDRHFESAPVLSNAPLLGGLLGWWHHDALGLTSRAIIPYARRLRLLPQFLQQLDMESNGKRVDRDGRPVTVSGPVVWGAEGTNAQHAFFQHLHQSPMVTPVEFICLATDTEGAPDRSRMTLANALAQAEALMRGKPDQNAPHRAFPGNRPSSMILLDALTPDALGSLLAFYEHRTFVEGVLWGINSFDQWGVELGKVIAREIDADLQAGPSPARDPGTAALIRRLRIRWSDGTD